MRRELPGLLLLQTGHKTVRNKYLALQGGIISVHASDQNQALHKAREPIWDTFR